MKDILKDLNNEQKKAVEHINGPMMVLAGAGSGKTRVLTYRVAHLINLGVDPMNILALTFTNKAAREMKDRIIKLVDNQDARNVWMGTFHSIFARILRIEAQLLNYRTNYTIYDTDDSKNLIKNILKEQQLDPKVYPPNYVLHRISSAKTNLISAAAYQNNTELQLQDKMAGKPDIGKLYSLYQQRCFQASAMDFDDLLFNTYKLLKNFPQVLHKYQMKFAFVLVDEYQDTNHVQYMIIKKLAANNENICVVGDDAQSIYGFRGANIQNILNLKRDYPDLTTYKLEQNYRSTKTIVKAANGVIINNKDQLFKEIWTENEEGHLVTLLRATTDNEEGTLVANAIFENKMNNQLRNDAFAILYRTNAQSRAFEESLRKLNIPYRIYGGLSFYKRKEIKDLLAYIRLVINNHDEEALFRIINYPARGIGKTSLQRIVLAAREKGISAWDVINKLPDPYLGVNAPTQSRISGFCTMIKSFSAQLQTKNAYDLAKEIANASGILKELYEDQTPEGISRFENIEELLNAIKDFTEKDSSLLPHPEEEGLKIRQLDEFMQEVALLTDADTGDKDDTNHVSLMTIHAAKGLEFPYVFVVGLEENLFPSIQSLNSRSDLEEERRLFYVSITRAEKKLTLSYAENRYRWGNLTITEPSRFIDELDAACIDKPQKASIHNPFNRNESQLKKFSASKKAISPGKNFKKINTLQHSGNKESINPDAFQTGMNVEHQRFGKGKIVNIEGAGPNKKATVFFKSVGQKQLLLRFAKLSIINDS